MGKQLDLMLKEAETRIKDYIEVLYVQAKISISSNIVRIKKEVKQEELEKYFKRRGYTQNVILSKIVYTKGFVCVNIEGDNIEIWHDVNKSKSMFINESYLTSLPITLDYMEKINY